MTPDQLALCWGSLVAYLAETYFGFATNRSTR